MAVNKKDSGPARDSALNAVQNMTMNAENQRELFQFDGLVEALLAIIKKDSGPWTSTGLCPERSSEHD